MADPSNKGERLVPAFMQPDPRELACHMARYVFALRFCANRIVLDAACGVGYGTQILSYVARKAIGIDYSRDAIEYAQDHYEAPRVEFRLGDVKDLAAMGQESCDVVVSFETIEHLTDPGLFVEQVTEVLAPDGMFVVSAPEDPHSKWHVREYTKEDLRWFLSKHFDMEKARYYCQGPTLEIVPHGTPKGPHHTHIFVCRKEA